MIKNRYNKLFLLLALLGGISSYAMHLEFGESLLEASDLYGLGAFQADAPIAMHQPPVLQEFQPDLPAVAYLRHYKPQKRKQAVVVEDAIERGVKKTRMQKGREVEIRSIRKGLQG